MEEADKENLLIAELDEETQSQSEEANEDKRDDKVDFYISMRILLIFHWQPEVLHGGRPKHEEPHVKKIKKRTYEKTEYILRVDLESLGINEDDFEDLQSLFEVDA